MPELLINQNVKREERIEAGGSGPSEPVLPSSEWTYVYNSALLAEVARARTRRAPDISGSIEAWAAASRHLGPEGLSPEEEQERRAFTEQPMTDKEIDVWRSKQVWGDE